ncbi:Type II secretion system F domain protein [Ferrimonas balearica DSM 9799]|uniref:Type II secretion system F domain protein n=1 Tax=Ferrimonas balearica (strain DSM 9799 / CCM 4581 / KCTC 23876 / PAT) TaxID=550540 RepID=E1SM25_FERBD|nr:type II secretion system F family protein [Ferrimonas balearica]MBY6019802.1 type II secretion system F family protein [Halomonas denitrificans]ADN76543.1 Type II secretion system F domain protein [Ferrimonas balearica DSM 9799]MBW3139444.1 type II secretion system F family protein [Ferrimonas balearica]MBW3162968.1 type II secretion system F family protein [Ferrimonas balearica]MBY5980660.1 type II secretion system F family protein [Ferrimonas balearica]
MDYILGVINEVLNDRQLSTYLFYAIAAAAGVMLALALSFLFSGLYSPTRMRLKELKTGAVASGSGANFDDALEHENRVREGLVKHLSVDNSGSRKRLIHAGFHSNSALAIYNGLRLLFLLLMAMVSIIAIPMMVGLSTFMQIYIIVMLMGLAILTPSFILDRFAASRMRKIRNGFPDALDLLVVCCESGQGLLAALQRVSVELRVSHKELAEELLLVCQKNRAGIELSTALHEFSERTGLDDIRGLNGAITQSLRLGTGIAETLRVYADEYRDKRMQAAEEMAAKLGVKIIFPMLTCIWPSFFIVAVGPAVIKVMEVWDKI